MIPPGGYLPLTLTPWLRLLARHGFAVHPRAIPHALGITLLSAVNSGFNALQNALFPTHFAPAAHEAPLFIIGFWRSGTTLLHELLGQDPAHTFPTTYQCMNPCHFLLTGAQMDRMGSQEGRKRPMDDVVVRQDSPQEDEFALLALGVPSIYSSLLFPQGGIDAGLAELMPEHWPAARQEAWIAALRGFLGKVARARPGRMVVKSPSHMAKVGLLAQAFPAARFIHIVRNPYKVFPSTRRMWGEMLALYGLQEARSEEIDALILKAWPVLEAALDEAVVTLPKDRYHRITFEALTADPLGALENLYQGLSLGPFDRARGNVEKYLAERGAYRARSQEVAEKDRQQVAQAWGHIAKKYGYETPAPPSRQP